MSFENTNQTNDSFSDEYEYYMDNGCPPGKDATKPEYLAKITMYVMMIVVSLIGNILIISVTRRTRSMQKVAFLFVVNMAIADLLTTLINMPESLTVEIRDSDEWLISGDAGIILCKILSFCQYVCAFCSILSLLAIALDRFLAICLPLKRIMTRRLAKVIIISTWLIPSISNAPMLVANIVIEEHGQLFCIEEWPAPFDNEKAARDYTIILFVFFYALPLVIISALYSCVIYKIWRRRAPGHRLTSTARLYARSRKKALKMFIAIVLCFALCWLPYHVVFFLTTFDANYHECGTPLNVYFVHVFFSHALSALNPCIYMVFNKDYRTGVKRLLASCVKRSDTVHPELNASSNINTHEGVQEDREMTTFQTRSPQSGISYLPPRTMKETSNHFDPDRTAPFVRFNLGFKYLS